jgi:predicted SAM-dependent methyltransferase
MKLQISPTKRIEDAMVIWHEKGPEVDLVMDARSYSGLTMKEGSIKAIYAFNILGLSGPKQILGMVQNFYNLLEPGGELYIIEMDFDYLNRAYLSADLSLTEFNNDFRRHTYLNQQELVRVMDKIGFPEKEQRAWYDNPQFKKAHYEMIISGKKPNNQ